MENTMVKDVKNVMDEPEQGCIVQADDPHMLPAAFDEANAPLTLSSNNSWYWTSMLKLMEQGAAPTDNIAYGGGFHLTPTHTLVPANVATSPSSSSVNDQPFDSMLANSNAINANDPDSLVWSQDILSGPICESKPSNLHHLACSDDGLHELLYPRTVLELLFSDQLKLEQLPASWPDFLQQTAGGMPGKSFGFPLPGLDKLVTPSGDLHNDNSENNQLDIKIPAYPNNVFSHLDDRLSSSTASSTLSDNTIDQWAPPNVGTQCSEHAQAPPTATMMHASALTCLQQMDHTLVKQEYPHALCRSPPYTSGDQYSKLSGPYVHQNQRLIANPAGNVINEAIFNEFEQKPALMNKLWSSTLLPDDPLNHRLHIYESITAANFSHNLRSLGALDAANAFHDVSDKHAPAGTESVDRSRVSSRTAPASLRLINQSSQQIGKKSRSLEMQGAGTGQVDDITKKESMNRSTAAEVLDTKAKGAAHILPPAGTNASSPNQQQQQQLSGAEYHFKRPRVDQTPTSSFKNPPIRKEKLGERITTLQQLVSPFGKTDTASVLLEAIGYIKFLQEQVQALSSPYFKSSATLSEDETKPDLRSRGLCLVPLSCTMQVANDNGADYWYGGAFR